MEYAGRLVALIVRVEAEVAHDADDLEPFRRRSSIRVVQSGADRRSASRHALKSAHECFIDDHRSGSGNPIAAVEPTPGNNRTIERFEVFRSDGRRPESQAEGRSAG